MQNEALVTQEICSADDTRYRGESAQDTRRSFALDMVQGQRQRLKWRWRQRSGCVGSASRGSKLRPFHDKPLKVGEF